MKDKLLSKADVILVLTLAAFGVLLFVLFTQGGGKTAIIEYDGKTVKEIDLENVKDEYSFEVEGDLKVVFTVTKDGIRFSASECPDGICMDFGVISKPGQIAVCAPARVSVRISGDAKNVDGVTG